MIVPPGSSERGVQPPTTPGLIPGHINTVKLLGASFYGMGLPINQRSSNGYSD